MLNIEIIEGSEKMKRSFPSFAAGLLCGALLFGGSAAFAAGVIATPFSETNQRVTLNGRQIELTGYNINGNNYFKLRDIGAQVGFNVTWNGDTHTVEIDTTAAYADDEARSAPAGAIAVPQTDAALFIPKAGDLILCDDGTAYPITDMSLHKNEGALPEPACDYAQFPTLTLPRAEARRLQAGETDYLFIRNLYETRRMQYTLYNAIGGNPQTWENGTLKLRGDGTPFARVQLFISDEDSAESFWPWRADQITADFESCPPGFYQLEAWDVYANGKYLYTEYRVAVGV